MSPFLYYVHPEKLTAGTQSHGLVDGLDEFPDFISRERFHLNLSGVHSLEKKDMDIEDMEVAEIFGYSPVKLT